MGPGGLITRQYFVKPLIALFGETMLLSDLQNVKNYFLTQIFSTNTTILFTKKSATTADILCYVYYM